MVRISEIKREYKKMKKEYGRLLEKASEEEFEEFLVGLYKETLKATIIDEDYEKAERLADIIEEISPIIMDRLTYHEKLALMLRSSYEMAMDVKRGEIASIIGAYRILLAGILSNLKMLLWELEKGYVDDAKGLLREWIPNLHQQLEIFQDLEAALKSNDTKALNDIRARVDDMLQDIRG